ncbi:MAG: repeat containing protein, partial [Thermoleophilia bacterium]|nr:repeat containing protein [Thermoleophilia bacterium]
MYVAACAFAGACVALLVATTACFGVNFTAGQASTRVIGAANHTDRSWGTSVQGVAAHGMALPSGVAFDTSGSAYVADRLMHRIMRWTSPTTNGQDMDTLLFRTATGSTPNIKWSWYHAGPSVGLNRPRAVSVAGDGATLKMAVADTEHNRVLLIARDESLLADGDTASVALGQAAMTGTTPGSLATDMRSPAGVWTNGQKVAVADTSNNRVLLWDSW